MSDHVPSASPLVDTLKFAVTRFGFDAPSVDVEFNLFDDLQHCGPVHWNILAWPTALDVFLAGRIAKGDTMALTVLERLTFEVKMLFAGAVTTMSEATRESE